jgi:Zn-dependent protease with chaperone function
MGMGHGIAVLGVLLATLLVVAPRVLPSIGWFDRAPRWGIACWLVAGWSAAAAVAAVPILLVLHLPGVGHDVADLVSACSHLLTTARPPAGRLAELGAVAGTLGLPLWIVGRVATMQVAAAVHRRAHCRDARVAAVRVDGPTLTLDYPIPAVYCVPGAHPTIVITTAARRRLSAAQLAAVQAHERAHLVGRHHLAAGLADGLVRALPWVSVIRLARHQVERLIELAADDAAARRHCRGTLADALAAVRCDHDGLDAHRERRLRQSWFAPIGARHHAAALTAIVVVALWLGVVVATVTSHGAECSAHVIDASP